VALAALSEPVDLATRETVAFIASNLEPGATYLEVGCGKGNVAAVLAKRGYAVAAIDADAESVAAAQALGVDARVATWPDFESATVDAIAFTRSIHHMEPLAAVIGKARAVLRSGGRLLVEDFAFEAMDAASSDWWLERTRAHRLEGFLAFAGWDEHYRAHGVHRFSDVARHVTQGGFTIRSVEDVPYLYRYSIPALARTPAAAKALAAFFEEESRAIASGLIVPLGRRLVATPR